MVVMMRRKPIIALIYDFDGTLSPGNMQEFGFIQAVHSTPEEFWTKSDGIARGQDASNILAYMKLMFDEARRCGIKLTREDFHRYGQDIKLFEGVREWFRSVSFSVWSRHFFRTFSKAISRKLKMLSCRFSFAAVQMPFSAI